MVRRSIGLPALSKSYFFVEIANRRKEFQEANKDAKLISLGVGDTTEGLAPKIVEGIAKKAASLGFSESYTGYPASFGISELRAMIAKKVYNDLVSADEVIISDGSKPDLGRIQLLFGTDAPVVVQNPTYPAYVDDSVISGRAGEPLDDGTYSKIQYLPCTPENDFFPELEGIKDGSLIYFCSPNNPTGAAATHEQLSSLVAHAKKTKSIIIFDSAYREFIVDPALPKSIFEIPGSEEVALELSSFSKVFGFTGVRLGWSVCPKALKFDDGSSVHADWSRIVSTFFNGASNLAEAAGIAAMESYREHVDYCVGYYLNNAKLLRSTLVACKLEVYGGSNSPYLWVKIPGMSSWEAFQYFMEKMHIIVTPGVGFGKYGEGFVRLSCFGHFKDINEAATRISAAFSS